MRELQDVCFIASAAVPIGAPQEKYLSYVLLDTSGALGCNSSTITLSAQMIRPPGYQHMTGMFPRADQRIRELAQREASPDAVGMMGLICEDRGDEQQAAVLFRRSMQLGAQKREENEKDGIAEEREWTLEVPCVIALSGILQKEGNKPEALALLQGVLKHDTSSICFATASAMGFKGPYARQLLVKAAASGSVQALRVAADMEMQAHNEAKAKGDAEAAEEHLIDALEWARIADAWKMDNKEEALRHF